MTDKQKFETSFQALFTPLFLKGFGVLMLLLTIWAFWVEFQTGSGPSMMYDLLPMTVMIAIIWVIVAVLVTLVLIAVKKKK